MIYETPHLPHTILCRLERAGGGFKSDSKMKLEDQVCTVSQGLKLEQLGVDAKPAFCHCHVNMSANESIVEILPTGFDLKLPDLATTWIAPAFTVAELAVMLPDYYPSWRFKVNEKSNDVKWVATVICSPKPPGIDDIHTAHQFDRFGKTQAEALATLLIALLETKVITADEVNERLTC